LQSDGGVIDVLTSIPGAAVFGLQYETLRTPGAPTICVATTMLPQCIDADAFDLPPSALPDDHFNVYLYDGAHDYESQV